MCSSCIDGYEEQTGGKCVPCPSGASSYVQDVVIAMLLVGLVVFSFWLIDTLRPSPVRDIRQNCASFVRRRRRRAVSSEGAGQDSSVDSHRQQSE